MLEYPKREKFYSQKVIRRMVKTCAAQEIGPNAVLLVAIIAACEDAKRYTGPVTYYNEQLLPIMGIRKWDTLNRARNRAVEAGWLAYHAPPSGSKETAGKYWTCIPERFADLDDSPTDEGAYPKKGDGGGEPIRKAYTDNGDGRGDGMVYGRGDAQGEPSNLTLNPSPSPNKRKAFVRPTVEQVKEYCQERQNNIDPEYFVDYQTTRGWKLKGGQPMKDWKAAIRTWEKNNFSGKGSTQTELFEIPTLPELPNERH